MILGNIGDDGLLYISNIPANDVVLVFSLLTVNIFHTFSSVSIVDFDKEVNVSWDKVIYT